MTNVVSLTNWTASEFDWAKQKRTHEYLFYNGPYSQIRYEGK